MAFTLPALADFKTVARAYELEPELVNIPLTPSSRILFSECVGCEGTSAQLTAQTRFSVDGKNVGFEEFCDAIRLAKQSERSGIILKHHLESNTVVFVSVFL